MYVGHHVKYLLFLSDLNGAWITLTNFLKILKFHENPSSGSRVVPCWRTDGQTDMTKLIVTFRSCANVPKNAKLSQYKTSCISLLGMRSWFLTVLFTVLMWFLFCFSLINLFVYIELHRVYPFKTFKTFITGCNFMLFKNVLSSGYPCTVSC
jgi:hypothetical protein